MKIIFGKSKAPHPLFGFTYCNGSDNHGEKLIGFSFGKPTMYICWNLYTEKAGEA